MSISIVIPIYNNSHFTKSCINDLVKLKDENITFRFVDNASADDTYEIIKKAQERDNRIWYFKNDTNEYFAKACNKGFASGNEEYVCYLNNDIRVRIHHKDWIEKLVEACDDGSVVGPTGGILGPDYHFIRHTDKIQSENFYLSAWCIMARRNTWDKLVLPNEIGPFDSSFGLFYEDSDLGLRCAKQNIPLKIVPIPVMHIGHATAKKMNMTELYMKAHKIFSEKWKNK